MKYIVLSRVKELVPPWCADAEIFAQTLDDLLDKYFKQEGIIFSYNPHNLPISNFWIEMNVWNGTLEIMSPIKEFDNSGWLIFYNLETPMGGIGSSVEIPLFNLFLRDEDMLGFHTLYMHGIQADVPLYYIGITKQNWYARLNQHVSDARNGSPYVFHRAISEHKGKQSLHKIVLAGIDYENAMKYEEEWVEMTLYPMGMNMIPGGYAGFRYLGSLGYSPKSFKQRDASVQRIIRMEILSGKPNPLCAARWASDQDFINRVICGHAGRLSVEQVRNIRRFYEFGKTNEEIGNLLEIKNLRQIKNVAAGKRYGRVK